MEKSLKINIPEGYEIDTEKSTFVEIVFKPIDSLKTWEGCIKLLKSKGKSFNYITDNSNIQSLNALVLNPKNYNLLPSRTDAEQFLTLQKLYICRQAYVGDWKPDWTDTITSKYVIKVRENKLVIDYYYTNSRPFSFPDKEMATKFFNAFRVDLEFIKEFL